MSPAEREIEELIGTLAGNYAPAFARAQDIFLNDERVEGLYLSGSLGRGDYDEWSDLDLTVLTCSGFDDFVADAHDWVARISEPVWSSRTTFGRDSFLATWIDRDWRRFDVVVRRVSEASGVPASLRRVFDRVERRGAEEDVGDSQLSRVRLRSLTDEFLRFLGLLVPVTGRGELEAAVTGFHLLRTALIELFTLANGGAPTGAKRLRSVLTAEQIAALRGLPEPGSTVQSIQTAHLAVAAAFLPLARDLSRAWGIEWPAEFEDATRAYLKRGLAADLP